MGTTVTEKTACTTGEPFGRTRDGRSAMVYTLENSNLRARITDYGGRIVSIETPDRSGRRGDVLLGFDDVATYAKAGGAFGALLGRTANRIAGGSFAIDGRTYQLPTNDGTSTLHGGPVGFDQVFWKVAPVAAATALVLTHVSPDGDQGFPGELSVQATYRLDGDSLWLDFEARTTKPTLASLSAHPYFNLAGAETGDVLDHVITIVSDAFLPTDDKQIPTGEMRSVAGTPFDFREPTPLAARIRRADPQLIYGTGYDQCFVLGAGQAPAPRLAARALDPASGRVLEIHTTQPGMQLYTGNKLNGSVAGRGGVIYRQSAGFAFEPQGFPDAPHHPAFPSTILRPGETYAAAIRYRFLVSEHEDTGERRRY
ncbi:MAG TPA: aldose epimerase family protein [Stellaceae bacterium]|nr:aldose epimerase family protein [Stellaceae bacterium]